jgi:hypothetical protein
MNVISKLLRTQQRDKEICERQHADEQRDCGIHRHGASLHQPIAEGDVADAHEKEQNRDPNEHDIRHNAPVCSPSL